MTSVRRAWGEVSVVPGAGGAGGAGGPVLALTGEVDSALVTAAEVVVEAAAGVVAVVDVSGVRFMDSAGVHLLLRLRERAPSGRLRVQGAADGGLVWSLLDLLGLGAHFTGR